MRRKIIVTSGLIYANGDLHLGHILEFIQTDIWVRFQKLRGEECYYFSGEDTHGTPIMINAQKQNLTPEKLIAEVRISHIKDAEDFLINFDQYHSTDSRENLDLTNIFYQKIKEKNDLIEKEIEQAFDPKLNLFLPDRFIKGTCPKCKAADQYGDNCEICGSSYNPLDLIDPRSTLTGESPILKKTKHIFFNLANHQDFLQKWLPNIVPKPLYHKLTEWFKAPLEPWDISRDAPYFGFMIPNTEDKYFYVWFDAPIGYLASAKAFSKKNNLDFDEDWYQNSNTELYHVIGKDILYFHGLFWPAILKSAGYRLPNALKVHGFLTVNGEKMSKSRGTFILARDYLNCFDPEYLRFYFAAKLNGSIEDLDLNLEEFIQRNNSDLVGKIVNIASRLSKFIERDFNGYLASIDTKQELWKNSLELIDPIIQAYEKSNFAHAMKLILKLADLVNQFIDQQKPWTLPKNSVELHECVSLGLNVYRQIIIFLKPILPNLAQKSELLFNHPPFAWEDLYKPLEKCKLNPFKSLMNRINKDKIDLLVKKR